MYERSIAKERSEKANTKEKKRKEERNNEEKRRRKEKINKLGHSLESPPI